MNFFFVYWFPCFLFGLWYYRICYKVDEERTGSDAWMGKWIATGASAAFLTFWVWPLLVVYLLEDYKKKKAAETEALKREAARRSQNYNT